MPLPVTRTLLCIALIAAACGGGDKQSSNSGASGVFAKLPPTPPAHVEGERLFNASCSSCHGDKGLGTQQGPPLVHIIYEPGHHSDQSFQMAAQRGVVAHHWRFGNMPPVAGVTSEQVTLTTSYVRWLQREAGID